VAAVGIYPNIERIPLVPIHVIPICFSGHE